MKGPLKRQCTLHVALKQICFLLKGVVICVLKFSQIEAETKHTEEKGVHLDKVAPAKSSSGIQTSGNTKN